MIGPPDPASNLRPIIRKVLLHETLLQQKLRLMQDDAQSWNHKFWSEHNAKFIKVGCKVRFNSWILCILLLCRKGKNT